MRVGELIGPTQGVVLQNWPELIGHLAANPRWHQALEVVFLTGAWPEGVAPPPLQRSHDDPAAVAAYRLFTGKEFDPDWIARHYRQVGMAARTRILARLRALGMAHILAGQHSWETLIAEADSRTAWESLGQSPPGWAPALLDRVVDLELPPDERAWLERLRSARPLGPLELDYPSPQKIAQQRWPGSIKWLAFHGERLVLWESPDKLWFWDPPDDPRRLAGELPILRSCFGPVPGGVIVHHPDRKLRRWDFGTRGVVWERHGTNAVWPSVHTSPDGSYLVLGSRGVGFRVLRCDTGQSLFSARVRFENGFISADNWLYIREPWTTPAGFGRYQLPDRQRHPLSSAQWYQARAEHKRLSTDSRLIDRGRGRLEVAQKDRLVLVGGHPDRVALSESARLLAVRRRDVRLYALRGEARERRFRREPYPDPKTPDERFAQLLWQFQNRHQVEIEDARAGSATDIQIA